jgi:hypothetical protein
LILEFTALRASRVDLRDTVVALTMRYVLAINWSQAVCLVVDLRTSQNIGVVVKDNY